MRHGLMLAAILAFGVSAYAQAPPAPGPEPIPSNPNEWHAYVGPIPTEAPSAHAGPLPAWPSPSKFEAGWRVFSSPVRPCAIVQPDGKRYRYFEGYLPKGIKSKKRFTAADLQRIKEKGGDFRVLKQGSGTNEMDAALDACRERGPTAQP